MSPARRFGVQVRFSSGTTHPARVLIDDSSHDLAVLQVLGTVPARPLNLGNSDQAQVGQTVLAFGSPFGLDGTLTQGIISARRRPPRHPASAAAALATSSRRTPRSIPATAEARW